MSKAFITYNSGSFLTKIKYEGGGEVPKELSGSYTSLREAKEAIRKYEASKKPSRRDTKREIKNASSENAA